MVNVEMMEFNKPSELCQILFVNGSARQEIELFKMTPFQVDLINIIYYKVRKTINQDKLEISEDGSTVFEYDLRDFYVLLNKYKKGQYGFLIDKLDELSNIKIVINSLGKNKDLDELTITRFIQEIKLSRHRKKETKKVKLTLSNTLIHRFLNVKKYFSKMFFKIQFSMVSKYSKLLYEILKDYERLPSLTLEYDMLLNLMNVVAEKQLKWMLFNQNILKKSVNEINEKSDIFVNYEPIKEKLEGQRLQVTKVKFFIKKQSETTMKQLGLIEESITSNKFYNKSKNKLDRLVKNGYKVIDEEMWIKTDIDKNENQYQSEVRIDTWLKETDKNDQNELFEKMASLIKECDDPIVSIEDYKIIGVFSKEVFTKNPSETIETLNSIISVLE